MNDEHEWQPREGEDVSCPSCGTPDPLRTIGYHGEPVDQIECECGDTSTRAELADPDA